ncbi:adenosine deaminase-like isoform X2 [Dermacentor albipictus]|uniref:adenosine deaminase-like isoform X2 n=1 Tax=Dermacentor albipictus TaxID=60249 RepID=UPI0038FC83E1
MCVFSVVLPAPSRALPRVAGELFRRMISGVSLPLVSAGAVAALGSSRPPALGRVALCALGLSLLCKCLAAAGALGLAAFLSPGNTVRLDVEAPKSRPSVSLSNVAIDRLLDFVRNLFPSNIIAAHVYTLFTVQIDTTDEIALTGRSGQKARKQGSSHMQQEKRRTMPLLSYKVQLHSHLDTYMRHETIWELSQQKDLRLNYNTVEDVREQTRPKKCTSLDRYLKEVPAFLRTILGDRDALERVAYEAGLDQARERVLYSEMRLPPQLLAASSTVLPLGGSPASAVSGRDVVDAALTGLRRAEQETGIKLRLILTCLRGTPEWAPEVLDLCREYSDRGVVGIDVCGVVAQRAEDRRAAPSIEYGEEITDPRIVQTFQRAASWGVHRTAHAGEAGPPATVLRAVHELHAERIGHGYRAVLDGGLAYRQALAADVHFECCLTSSMLTGAVDPNSAHPVLRLRRDGASFSISVDDPAITHTSLEDEYRLALKLGLGPGDLLQCNRSAISACFLPADEKWELWQKFNQLTNAVKADT